MNKEQTLAKKIINYSLDIKKGDKVLITYQTTKALKFVKYLIKEIVDNNALAFANYDDVSLSSYLNETSSTDRISLISKYKEFELNNFDAFINIKYNINDFESKNIPISKRKEIMEATYETHNKLVNTKKWVLLNYPSTLDAFKSKMTYEEFYDYAFDVTNVDYEEMKEDIKPLKALLEKTNIVTIKGNNTDISFSIKDMPVIPCVGNYNIPDGELYTAPIKDSVNGKITYNTESTYNSEVFKNISLEFKDGKIINFDCESGNKDKLKEIFETDEGAKYIGEFSFGLNPKILEPMSDILYDEKIKGSIHFTPGSSYQDCYNGNDSNVHWDLVLIQRKEYGGGEIYLDDVLVRKDGIFVLDELKKLNYE